MTEAIAEPIVETPMIQGEPKAKPFFTKENAKMYAAQAAIARKQAIADRQARLDAAKAFTELAPSEVYRQTRLAHVRSQLAKVDTELDELLDDPSADQSRLKAILEASKVLSEQERKLSNRPDPGSHRPSPAKRTKEQPTSYEPVD